MMEMLSQISNKYSKNYFGFNDKIKRGTKVIYLPNYGSFIRTYYDLYDRFKFKPGDTMTVKLVRKSEHLPQVVYVYENKCIFSPRELLPVEVVKKEDIKKVLSFYKEYKKNHKLE